MAGDPMGGALSGALQVRPWRGDQTASLLVPTVDGLSPSVGAVRDCVAGLARAGQRMAFTGALPPAEQAPFLAAGFTVHERLHLLVHDLAEIPPAPSGVSLRRSRRRDRPVVLEIDQRAFDDFWRLDDPGLDEAQQATPVSRFRVATDGRVVGYAVSGRSGPRGYLQRLAVDPAVQHRGFGTALVVDGMRWMHRRGVKSVAVNTQEGNAAALSLYERLGFHQDPNGLAVLSQAIAGTGP